MTREIPTAEVAKVYRYGWRRYLTRTGAIRAMARTEARNECHCDDETGFRCGCNDPDELKDREREIRQLLRESIT